MSYRKPCKSSQNSPGKSKKPHLKNSSRGIQDPYQLRMKTSTILKLCLGKRRQSISQIILSQTKAQRDDYFPK